MQERFGWRRCGAILRKEFVQMSRDKLTLAMIIAIPLLQLLLFGYAINTNPRHLPTAIVMGDHSAFVSRFIQGLSNSQYFTVHTETNAKALQHLKEGKI